MLRLPRSPFPPHTGIEFVKVNNIVYCQAENTYAYIHTSLNETILVTRP
jgi:DNA-binding LytR/AlgR family response regulator